MSSDQAPKPKRGLSALLATTTHPAPVPQAGFGHSQTQSPVPEAQAQVLQSSLTTADVPLTAVRPNPTQPRTHFEPQALAELAASIKTHGLLQPIVLRQLKAAEISGEARYELIAGERRWRAAQSAGLSTVPAIIKDIFSERDILLLSLIENLQRDDLNPVEEAYAYDRLAKNFKLTHEQIADGVGKSRATVSNVLRLLELPTSVQDALRSRKLTIGHAKLLLAIPDSNLQRQLAAKTEAENLTVRDLERLIVGESFAPRGVPQHASQRAKGSRGTRLAPPNLQALEARLREHFGTKVLIEENLRKGRIVIEFYSADDFNRIVTLMDVEP